MKSIFSIFITIIILMLVLNNCGNNGGAIEGKISVGFDLTNISVISFDGTKYNIENVNINDNYYTKLYLYNSDIIQIEGNEIYGVHLEESIVPPLYVSSPESGPIFTIDISGINFDENYAAIILSWDNTLIPITNLKIEDINGDNFSQLYSSVLSNNQNSLFIGLIMPKDVSIQNLVQNYNTGYYCDFEYDSKTYYPAPLEFFRFSQSPFNITDQNIVFINAFGISNEKSIEGAIIGFENAINNDDVNSIQNILSPESQFYITGTFDAFLDYFDGFRPITFSNFDVTVDDLEAEVYADINFTGSIDEETYLVMRKDSVYKGLLFPEWQVKEYWDTNNQSGNLEFIWLRVNNNL